MGICKKTILPILATGVLSGCVSVKDQDTANKKSSSSLFSKQPYKVMGTRGGVVPLPMDEPVEKTTPSTPVVLDTPVAVPVEIDLPQEPTVDTIDEPTVVTPQVVELERYTVKKGDSLWRVAKMYSVSIAELAEVNNFPKDRKLKIKEVILIPEDGVYRELPKKKKTTPKKSTSSATKTSKPRVGSSSVADYRPKAKQAIPADGKYTVQNGDSLWLISSKFGVSIAEIKAWNDLKNNNLHPGKVLVLKDDMTQPSAPAPAPVVGISVPKEAAFEQPTASVAPEVSSPENELSNVIDPLKQPVAPAAAATPADATPISSDIFMDDYTIQPNDTLASIAELFVAKPEDIKKANPGVNLDGKLNAGDIIRVPVDMGATE